MQVRDCGDASPRNVRLTLNYVPCSADMAKTSAMPLAVILQPLALPGPDDDELPVCARVLCARRAHTMSTQAALQQLSAWATRAKDDTLGWPSSSLHLVFDPCTFQCQVVDFGEGGPVRCTRCKAYMNAFMAFVDAGRKFRCNICGHLNHTCASACRRVCMLCALQWLADMRVTASSGGGRHPALVCMQARQLLQPAGPRRPARRCV
jgi:protein transport protein SEC24